jgi:L-iditol 2-dehydrogenase
MSKLVSGTMKAWVLHGIKDMRLETQKIPDLQPGEALVKIKSVGICGSDMHYFLDGKIGSFVVENPLILGHECSGEVVDIAENVKNVKIGDRVAIEAGKSCGDCWYCKNGRYNKCPDMQFMATPPYDGCLVEYVAWPAKLLFQIPDSMSYEEGAMLEPYTCSIAAVRRSGVPLSSSCLVMGMGPIGLLVLESLKAAGVGDIICVDVLPYRLEKAKEMGATYVINALEEDVVGKVRELTGGRGVQYAYETAGTDKTYSQIAHCVADGGTITLSGLLVADGTPMPMSTIVINEINLIAVFRYCNVYEEAIAMVRNKRVDIMQVVTNRFAFDDSLVAFEFSANHKDDSLKTIIDFD